MTIASHTYTYLLANAKGDAGEIGGILGGTTDGCVTTVVFDRPTVAKQRYHYDPNVAFLNEQIALWQQEGIAFLGMFHSHIAGIDTLSCGDKRYIDAILRAMPDGIRSLYFPILVFPDKKLCCYRADLFNGQISVTAEPLLIAH